MCVGQAKGGAERAVNGERVRRPYKAACVYVK